MAEFKFSVKATRSFVRCLQAWIDESPEGLLQFCFIMGTRAKKAGIGWKSLTSPREVLLFGVVGQTERNGITEISMLAKFLEVKL